MTMHHLDQVSKSKPTLGMWASRSTINMVSAMINNTKIALTSSQRYSECLKKTHDAPIFESDLITFTSHELDVELGTYYSRRVVSAVLGTEEITVNPDEPKQWHTPSNEREYLRSPQRAMWRTAKEKKMDQYVALKVFKLVKRSDVKTRIMGSLWAYKIKFNELGKFDKLTLGGASKDITWTSRSMLDSQKCA